MNYNEENVFCFSFDFCRLQISKALGDFISILEHSDRQQTVATIAPPIRHSGY